MNLSMRMVCVDVFIFFLAYVFSDASRASTPSQVIRAETQARHTSVAEIALEASQDGSDKEVHIFAKHLEGQL